MLDKCFLIFPIGKPDTETRRRSNQWVKHVVAPVASEFGYELIRADEMPNSGIITNQVIEALVESQLVIADLTGGNPNVFYELAIRHVSRKPYIQMLHSGHPIPFDLQGVRTIEYNLSDPDHLVTAGTTLKRHIGSIRAGHKVDSPVSMALTQSLMSQDSNAVAVFLEKFWRLESDVEVVLKGIDQLKESIQDMESSVSSLESDVSSIESEVRKFDVDRSSHTAQDIWRMQRGIDLVQAELETIKSKLPR